MRQLRHIFPVCTMHAECNTCHRQFARITDDLLAAP